MTDESQDLRGKSSQGGPIRGNDAALNSEAKTNQKDPSQSIPAEVQKKGKVIGNRQDKFYYLPGMKGYEEVDPSQRVELNYEREAIKAVYRKA